ncbi:MAG: cobyrinate a,c-diamide synthase [Thermodesulfovibrionia bacterium]|nr:cobyrinate a,c-diamide synthase [Thermodesulfovibrionia bacterium]
MAKGLVIAGTHSGCGKTTVTLGILAALKKKGLRVQSFKAGPDFIDSGLHRLITGRHSRNLDLWMCGEDYVSDCFYRHSMDADISVVEGVMGLYDGEFSTARLSSVLNLPVILVVDAYGMAESAGAVVKGFVKYSDQIQVTSNELKNKKYSEDSSLVTCHLSLNWLGVIFNRVASEKHYKRLKDSVHNISVFGYLPRELDFEIPHRHLGLTVAEENPITVENIEKLADTVLKYIDVETIIQKTGDRAQKTDKGENSLSSVFCARSPEVKIAVACDRTFCFYYEDNLDLLKDAGAGIITFSLISDTKIPDNVDALYIGGGYPELYAKELSENASMLKSISDWANSWKPIYAECGGLMYLSRGIYDFEGNFHRMAQVFPFETVMKKDKVNLGYREIRLLTDSILGIQGDVLRGHEFHYSEITDRAQNTEHRTQTKKIYSMKDNKNYNLYNEGYRFKNTLASYVHVHFGSNLNIAKNFVNFLREA